jgi:hypothetical protein
MLAWGGIAWAQSPTETPEGANSTTENSSGQLEEVVVTAEKRTEDVQKIPIVVETASAEDLERSGALQLRDLERAIPDVIIAPQGPAVTLMIRGVFSTDTSPGSENADAINLDGAYLAKTQDIAGMLFDVQRIEVAEGPQGTLYGRNANGGAINIITNKAQVGQDSATGTLEIGSYQLEHADGAINLAVGDTFAVRAAFHDLSHQGYYIGGLDDADEKGARVGFTWKPTDAQSLWVTYDDITIGGTGAGSNVVFATPARMCSCRPIRVTTPTSHEPCVRRKPWRRAASWARRPPIRRPRAIATTSRTWISRTTARQRSTMTTLALRPSRLKPTGVATTAIHTTSTTTPTRSIRPPASVLRVAVMSRSTSSPRAWSCA